MLKNISYLKFKRFYAPNPRKLNWYEIAWRWAQCYINQRHCEKHLRRLSQKKCQNHDHKQQQFTLTWRIWWTRQCRVFIFGHHTEQQQVQKIKSKCYLNVLHLEKRWCCPARKNSCMFGESSFRKSSHTVYLFTRFDIYPVKILLAMSLVLVKHKGKLQSCLLDLMYHEKVKHQWQLFVWNLSGFCLRTQGYKMQTCVTNFNSVILIKGAKWTSLSLDEVV